MTRRSTCSNMKTKPNHHRYLISLVITALIITRVITAYSAPETKELLPANNTFALDLYSRLAKQPGNLVLSPFSVGTALAMASAGARGETARQMASALHLPDDHDHTHSGFLEWLKEMNETNASSCQLVIANSLWVQHGASLKGSFKKVVHDQYDAMLGEVDFKNSPDAARKQINAWIAAKTRGKIPDLIEPDAVHSQTDLVLANAIYFKGRWEIPFDPEATKHLPFRPAPGETVSVPIMHATRDFRYAETATLQALEIPYSDAQNLYEEPPYASNRFSMVILLPTQADDLPKLERELTAIQLDRLRAQGRSMAVSVSLPKFKINSGFRLKAMLQAMGISHAFSAGRADFSAITGSRSLSIEFVRHQAQVDIDESGTEATGATAVGETHGFHMAPPQFNADHPFLFLIRHNPSGTILFIGRVTDPLSGVSGPTGD
ncbi:MAG: proteinase inhibitor serpin [Pedosphaera sp.]|nr:proteinase inhibitor serpin [Pedosphaera sp.]